jgi:tetratricopeptide (TPR) repeat protein
MLKWIYFAAGYILAQGSFFRVSGWDDAPNLLPIRLLLAAGGAFFLALWAITGMKELAERHAKVRRKVGVLVPIRELEIRRTRDVMGAAGLAAFAVLTLTSFIAEYSPFQNLLFWLAGQAPLWAILVILFVVRELFFLDENVAQRPYIVYGGWSAAIFGLTLIYMIVGSLGFFILLVVVSVHAEASKRFSEWVMEPYREADYEEAMRRAKLGEKLGDASVLPTGTYYHIQADVNVDAQRFAEATRVALKVLNAKGVINIDDVTYAGMLNALTMVAFERNNLQEAAELSEVTADILPVDDAYETQAYMFLQRGANARAALQAIEKADNAKDRKKTIQTGSESLLFGDKAWALALQKEFDQIDRFLSKGQARLKDMKPTNAAFHYRAGMARLIQKQFDAAVTHFETAVDLDPLGYWGSKAQEVLDKRSEPSPLQDVYEQAREQGNYRL